MAIQDSTMKLKEIHRSSTFAWSSFQSLPLLATGTVAGALDESFSNESHLEIWAPDFLDRDEVYMGAEGQHGPKGRVKDTARFVYLYTGNNLYHGLYRFNRLVWGHVHANRPQGVIAAGLENGELALWDPAKILAGAGYVVAKLFELMISPQHQHQHFSIPDFAKCYTYGPSSRVRF